jgi:hypothetical protein
MLQYIASIDRGRLDVTDMHRGMLIHRAGIDELKQELSGVPYTWFNSISFTSVTLRSRIERFSEQYVANAEAELAAYVKFRNGRALEVMYPDLLYFSEGPDYLFNKSVAAAIGEGMAGFLVQRLFGFIPQARPLGLSPDIIMQRNDEIAFVEAKATLATSRSSLPKIVNDAAVDLMHFLTTAPYLKEAEYSGFVVGTEIEIPEDNSNVNRFRCRILEIAQ